MLQNNNTIKEIICKEICQAKWQDKQLNLEIYLITIFMRELDNNSLNIYNKMTQKDFIEFYRVTKMYIMTAYKIQTEY